MAPLSVIIPNSKQPIFPSTTEWEHRSWYSDIVMGWNIKSQWKWVRYCYTQQHRCISVLKVEWKNPDAKECAQNNRIYIKFKNRQHGSMVVTGRGMRKSLGCWSYSFVLCFFTICMLYFNNYITVTIQQWQYWYQDCTFRDLGLVDLVR